MRLLMCEPVYFDVAYEINAWMHVQTRPDPAFAATQWRALHGILSGIPGVDVELVPPAPDWPDMVFTANAGIVSGSRFIPSRFRYAERAGEVPHLARWFESNGFEIAELPADVNGAFEGEGDALFYGATLLAGYRPRSDAAVYAALSGILACEILPLELVDPRWYHVDTCLTPLRPDLLAYYPPAFDSYAVAVIELLPGEKITLTEHDALRFAANCVVAGDTVVMNSACDDFAAELERRGFTVLATNLSEFLKAGGAAKCLTLYLDTAWPQSMP